MRKIAGLGAVMLAIVTVWLCWPAQGPAAPAQPTAPRADHADPQAATAVATAAVPVESVADATAQRTEAAASGASSEEFVLRGRCVDSWARPVAGVTATLQGLFADTQRMDAWLKDHAEPQRLVAKVTTGNDGVFEFRFWPLPPFQFLLALEKSGFASMRGRWPGFEAGCSKDLGDVAMERGTLLRGRVVDSDGVPVSKVGVQFASRDRDGEIAALAQDTCAVRSEDGSFLGSAALPAGTYQIEVARRTLTSPKQLVLDGSAAEQFVEVVVTRLDDAAAIRGIVVDERQQPLDGVAVNVIGSYRGPRWSITTDAEGRFRMDKAGPDDVGPLQLEFVRKGYEVVRAPEQYAWGRGDLHITLRKGLDVEVLVVAAADAAPIEDYQVRFVPQDVNYWSSADLQARGAGHHDGGRARIAGIRRGRYAVLVEPKDAARAQNEQLPLTVADPGPVQVTVRLATNVQRELRVQRADGSPVANVRVQLADCGNLEVTPKLEALPLGRWCGNNARFVLELQAVTTDSAGRTLLRGPGDRGLALLLPGPPNLPMAVADVRLDVAEPLVVTVSTGARLEGTVRPPGSIAELRRLAGIAPTGLVKDTDEPKRPTIQLVRGEGTRREEFPRRDQPAYVANDGTFALAGAPPGTWTVQLCWSKAIGGGRISDSQPVGTVALQDGATAHLDIDASVFMPGDLDGTVLHNGAPLAEAMVDVNLSFGKDARGYDLGIGLSVKTDAEGRFHFRTRAADCSVSLSRQRGDHWSTLRAPEHVFVVAGQTVAQTFHLQSVAVRVRLLDAAGQPVAAVSIDLRDATGTLRQLLPATDTDGRTSGEIEPGPFTAAVLPRRLQDKQALQQFYCNNSGIPDPPSTVRIALGEVQAVVGESKEVELRLPADW